MRNRENYRQNEVNGALRRTPGALVAGSRWRVMVRISAVQLAMLLLALFSVVVRAQAVSPECGVERR